MFCSGLPAPRLGAPAAISRNAAFALAFSAAAVAPAASHDAKGGWTYPLACCSDFDCREVADSEVLERPEGYVIRVTGEVVPMTSRKVRPSPDGVFHWCSVAGKADSATICLFVPPRAY